MQKARWLLEMVFQRIGKRPMREITAPELLGRSDRRRLVLQAEFQDRSEWQPDGQSQALVMEPWTN
jgi:hypothetical protein